MKIFDKNLIMNYILLIILSFSSVFGQSSDNLKKLYANSFGDWKLSSEFQVFSPENLYDYIDGGADNFLSYDFQELLVGTYKKSENNYINVEIYVHKALPQAFGIYSSEKPTDGKFEKIGTQGYVGADYCNFYTGNFYVKISTHETGSDIPGLLREIADSFAYKLVENPTYPRILGAFPKQDKVENSEMFINTNFLGSESLHSAYQVSYQKNSKTYKIFIIENKTAEDAKAMIDAYAKTIKTSFADPSKVQVFNDPYNGIILMKYRENLIWGILNEQNIKVDTDSIMVEVESNLFK